MFPTAEELLPSAPVCRSSKYDRCSTSSHLRSWLCRPYCTRGLVCAARWGPGSATSASYTPTNCTHSPPSEGCWSCFGQTSSALRVALAQSRTRTPRYWLIGLWCLPLRCPALSCRADASPCKRRIWASRATTWKPTSIVSSRTWWCVTSDLQGATEVLITFASALGRKLRGSSFSFQEAGAIIEGARGREEGF